MQISVLSKYDVYQNQKIKTAKIKILIFIKRLDFSSKLMRLTQYLIFFLSHAFFIALVNDISANMSIEVL